MLNNKSDLVDFSIKILIYGDSNVGKKAIRDRFNSNVFFLTPQYIIPQSMFTVTKVNQKEVRIESCTSSGQEAYQMFHYFHLDVNGVLLVYDITNRKSFDNLNYWMNELDRNCFRGISKILIGNKNDLEEDRKINYEEGKQFAIAHNMIFIETSAKNKQNVIEAFALLIKQIIHNEEEGDTNKLRKKELGKDINIKQAKCY